MGRMFQFDPPYALQLTLETLDDALQHFEDEPDFWRLKGEIFFTRQQFKSAYAAYSKYPDKDWVQLRMQAIEAMQLTELDEPVTGEQFVALIQALDESPTMQSKILYYDTHTRQDMDHHVRAVKNVFQAHNPKWSGSIEYDAASKSLYVSGPGVDTLRFRGVIPACLLYSIRPDTLILDGIDLDARELSHLGIMNLELRNCSIERPGFLLQLDNLRSVTADKGIIKPNQVEFLRREGVEVR